MTNSSKKPAKASRDNLDLDLEARLDQATSTLPLDDEPSTGDTLDRILARAKKEIDAELPEELTLVEVPELDISNIEDEFDLDDLSIENNEIVELENLENFRQIKSNAMTSMEKQLAATMNTSITSPEEDEELDRLLSGSGFDFDSLLGEAASDEIVTEIPEMNEDSLMAAVDELLTFGVTEESVEIAVEPKPKPKSKRKPKPEVVLDKIIEPEENELDSDVELTVEPEVALDDLVDTVPFEDILKVDFEEELNNFDDVADSIAPLVEISTFDESLDDDFNAMQQLNESTETMENKNDSIAAGFDLLDDDALEKESSISVAESDDDWMKQLEGLDEETAEPVAEEVTDDDDWMKQLEGLDEETAETAVVEKPADEEVTDDDDWMKQLEGLDEETAEPAADEDDWMKQLDGVDEQDEDTAKMLMSSGHDDSADEVADSNFNITNEPAEKTETRVIDEEALIANAADLAISQFKDEQDHTLSQLRADQDTIEGKNKKQFIDAENKRKKTATLGYIALGVGVIGLLGSAGIGWLSYGTKDKAETLTQSVTALEEKVDGFLAKNPEKEIENLKTSVEQLNQKVEKLVIAQAQIVVPAVETAPVVEHGKTVPTIDAGKTSSPVAASSNGKVTQLSSKAAQTSPNISVPKVAIDSSIIPAIDIAPENLAGEKEDEPTKLKEMVKKTADTKKSAEAAKAEAELLSQKIAKANAVAKAASVAAPTSKTEKTNYYTGRTTRGMARGGEKERSETTKTTVATPSIGTTSKEILNTTIVPKKAISAGKYSVNVISYQQEWFAQSKAAEFKQKGIPVEVVPVDINDHATRYRLKVTGFKNKGEANAYAEKIKKQHNLNEAWVGVNE